MESSPNFLPISKNFLKEVRQLKLKKYRYKYKKFIAEGRKISSEVLNALPEVVEAVLCKRQALERIPGLKGLNNKVFVVEDKDYNEVSHLDTPSDIMLVCKMLDKPLKTPIRPFSIYLDQINDPGNLGTIIRIADWFGCPGIYCSELSVDPFNSKTIQSSMGSIFRVSVKKVALEELVTEYEVVGATMEGESDHLRLTDKPILLLMGSESHGIDEEKRRYCQQMWSIPSFSLGAESLNVGVATGILVAEIASLSSKEL